MKKRVAVLVSSLLVASTITLSAQTSDPLPVGAGPAERTMNFPDCQGTLGQMVGGRKAYRLDCTTKPNMGPGWTVTTWAARGWVRVM